LDALPGRIAAVAGSQHALITAEQLAELDVTRHQRAHLLAAGQVRRVGPGVFLLNGAPFTWKTCIAAARLGVGVDTVVSHRSAAALYALDGFDQQRVVHLSVGESVAPAEARRSGPSLHRASPTATSHAGRCSVPGRRSS
jgi:hypothetical protein